MSTTYSPLAFLMAGEPNSYALPFTYMHRAEVKASIAGVAASVAFLDATHVALTPAPTTGQFVVIYRDTQVDLADRTIIGGVLASQDINKVVQQGLQADEEMQETLNRTLRSPIGDTPIGPLLSKAARANRLMAFDANGDPTVGAGPGAAALIDLSNVSNSTFLTKLNAVRPAIYVSPRDFNPSAGTGGDDTTAIQAALNTGHRVWLDSTFRYSSTLTVPAGGGFEAVAPGIGTLMCTSPTAQLLFPNSANRVTNVRFDASVTRTTPSILITSNQVFFEGCEWHRSLLCAQVGIPGGALAVNVGFFRCSFGDPVVAAGSGSVYFAAFSNGFFNECVVVGTSSGPQQDFGLRLNHGDTFFCSDTNITRAGTGLLIDPQSGQGCFAARFTSSLFDSSIGTGVSCASLGPAAGGGIFHCLFTGCWFGLSAGGSGCFVTGSAGIVDGVGFTECQFPGNGIDGLTVIGPNALNIRVNGGRSPGNTASAGVRFVAATKRCMVVGHNAGPSDNVGPNAYGVYMDASAHTDYVIANNILKGNTAAAFFEGTTGSPTKVTTPNLT